MINAAGIGTGLDVHGLVEQLMSLENRNYDRLQSKESSFQAQLSAYGVLSNDLETFKTAMSNLADMDKFNTFSNTVSDETVLSITTSAQASQGQHEIDITQLAVAHKLDSNAFTDGATSMGATGTISITVGSESFEVTVDPGKDTLYEIRSLINNASDNTGVKASILNVDDGMGGTESRLVLVSNSTGTSNGIVVSDVSGTVAATLNLTESDAAKDAILILDGYTVTRSSNSIDDALEGVTINLLKKVIDTVDVNIERDTEAVKTSIQDFVDAYNVINKKLNDLAAGDLNNESTLRLIQADLRNIVMGEASGVGTYGFFFEIGIHTSSNDGVASNDLSIESDVLDDALDENFYSVAALFADSSNGFAVLLENVANNFIKYDGPITTKQDGLKSSISRMEDAIENESRNLEKIEKRYFEQFIALDTLVASLQATNDYLTQQMDMMKGLFKK